MPELTAFEIAVIGFGFFLGGFVKGIVAFGLPFFALSIAITVVPLPLALSFLAVANFTSNVYLAVTAGSLVRAIKRFWTLIIPLMVLTYPAVQIMANLDRSAGEVLLGVLCLAFAGLQALPVAPQVPPHWEKWMSPLLGVVGGVLCGLSGLFGPPLVMYLVALRLPKADFVSAAALFFVCGATSVYASLMFAGILTGPVWVASGIAAIPVFVGLWIGSLLRDKVNETLFRYLLLGMLALLGASLIWRGLT